MGTAVSPPAFSQAMHMTRRRGTVSLVGLPPGDFPTPIFEVVLKRITIRGSIVGTRKELARARPVLVPGGGERTEIVTFVARHRRARVTDALTAFGLRELEPVSLWLPRPVLYDTWNVLGTPPLSLLHRELREVDVVHAPSLAVPPRAARAPIVVTAHDAAPLLFPETYPYRGRWFHRRGLSAAARRAAAYSAACFQVCRWVFGLVLRRSSTRRARLRPCVCASMPFANRTGRTRSVPSES